ncbi:MAG TPA: GIY-YIG nuclease family protein [Kiritimatiellia bacterium]|nr:GIY-YIG nuclease family protein [Kiritimatiellia bacterium]HNS81365.1 GIY-YIG nuclease family protein [Kiritimatiellia bacterium]HPA78465.1 GIY-YIG nuclease family protein [Kiritimatiellia bacterium]HQQ04716.1 GIY-YIG nuclease family protein [Kiritimatiellia bacterium]
MNPLMDIVYCVYVLRSLTDGKMYIGYSANLEQRLSDHFNGKVQSTAPRRPLKLIHAEYFLSEDDARRREGYLKTTRGKRALKLMMRVSESDNE